MQLGERFRPSTIEEVLGQEDAKKIGRGILARWRKDFSPPQHLLLSGPGGTGKTSFAVAIAREILGDYFSDSFTMLNASDERGIDTVRLRIKAVASQMPPNGRLQIIFLDEVDGTTKDFQTALRAVMEAYSTTTWFILAANFPEKIISPISMSRCLGIRFSPVPVSELAPVCEAMGLDASAAFAVATASGGDVRRLINLAVAALDGVLPVPDAMPANLLAMTETDFANLTFVADPDALLDRLHAQLLVAKSFPGIVVLAEAAAAMSTGATKVLQLQAAFSRLKRIA